jgi:hypothetical protein
MAWENRLTLDMTLAEKGEVCIMIGVLCCMYIPNNTVPDGTITKALQGLITLSNELAENLSINDPFNEAVWEMEGLDDLNLNLVDRSGWSFNFSRMLHNSLCLRTNTVVNRDSSHQTITSAYKNNCFY